MIPFSIMCIYIYIHTYVYVYTVVAALVAVVRRERWVGEHVHVVGAEEHVACSKT